MTITLNSIQCNHCQSVIVSKHVHDYVVCTCGAVAVDGGNEYLRRAFKTSPEADYKDLSVEAK